MSGRYGGGGGNRNKVLLPPINFIFKLLQQHSTVQIWLFEQLGIRIEGKIRGFDEFMNLVVDDAVEVKQATKQEPNPEESEGGGRRQLGELFTGLLWDLEARGEAGDKGLGSGVRNSEVFG